MDHQMPRNFDIKLRSRRAMSGKTFTILGMLLIIYIVNALVGELISLICGNQTAKLISYIVNNGLYTFTAGSFFYLLLTWILQFALQPANIGLSKYCLEINRVSHIDAPFDVLLDPYKGKKHVLTIIGVYIVKSILISIATIFFVIPGIILSFSYALTPYLLAEEKGLTTKEVLKKSSDMMKGHKGQLFLLELSFVGWFIISTFTFYILLLWVIPYMMTSLASFYEEVRLTYYGDPEPDQTIFYDEEQTTPQAFSDF